MTNAAAALAAYLGTFAGDTREEVALREYEGKRYRVTPALEAYTRERSRDRWTWCTEGTEFIVTSVDGDTCRIQECKDGAAWTVGGIPTDLLVEVK